MFQHYNFQGYSSHTKFLGDTPVVRRLIFINLLVFCMDSFLARPVLFFGGTPVEMGFLQSLGYFSTDKAFGEGQIWRLISFQFLHGGFGHLFFNLLTLYFFGPLAERLNGSRNFLVFYLFCGMGGALFYTSATLLGSVSPWIPMMGASAGIYGILLMVAILFPDLQVRLLFPPIALRMRTLALFLLGYAVLIIFSQGRNYGGEIGHLGGAFMGYFLIRNKALLNHIAEFFEGIYEKFRRIFRI